MAIRAQIQNRQATSVLALFFWDCSLSLGFAGRASWVLGLRAHLAPDGGYELPGEGNDPIFLSFESRLSFSFPLLCFFFVLLLFVSCPFIEGFFEG